MRVSRLFLNQPLEQQTSDNEISVHDQDRIHYAKNVLRLSPNDPIVIFNNHGGEFACKVIHIDKKSLRMRILEHLLDDRSVPIQLTIAISVIKRDAMDTAIQKTTEHGATRIVPLISDRVSVSIKQIKTRQEHWQKVAISACEQCGLNRVPDVCEAKYLDDWLPTTNGSKFIADVAGPAFRLPVSSADKSLTLMVGPEGGFTAEELAQANNNGIFAVNLGPRVLRAETAAISLITLANQGLSLSELS